MVFTLVTVTLLFVLAQLPLLIVHISVALVPTGTPVIVVLNEVGDVIVAAPEVNVHKPVPGEGLLPANTNVPVLH